MPANNTSSVQSADPGQQHCTEKDTRLQRVAELRADQAHHTPRIISPSLNAASSRITRSQAAGRTSHAQSIAVTRACERIAALRASGKGSQLAGLPSPAALPPPTHGLQPPSHSTVSMHAAAAGAVAGDPPSKGTGALSGNKRSANLESEAGAPSSVQGSRKKLKASEISTGMSPGFHCIAMLSEDTYCSLSCLT